MIDLFQSYPRVIVGALAFVISCWASSHALIHRRDPRAALWWVAVVWALPYLGALLYYIVGINRIKRRMQIRRQPPPPRLAASAFSRNTDDPGIFSPESRHLVALARLLDGVVGKPLLSGNDAAPLLNGEQAYPAMLEAIEHAHVSVTLMTYILNQDQVGQKFIEALSGAVARRVQVRTLIDDVGSGFHWKSVYKRLKAANVPVAYFLPTLIPWRVPYINLRNHRKLLVVDGKTAFVGSMNIHEGHTMAPDSRIPTQDIQFRVEGPVVAQLQEAFREDWYFTTRDVIFGPTWFPKLDLAGHVSARAIADGPDENFGKCRWTLLGALANASKSVKIVTPYFVPDSTIVTALCLASMSGIQVDIILPEVTDLAMVQWASRSCWDEVMNHGCRIWLTPPPFDHSKFMLVDGAWALFGSSNWDTRSLRLNFELNVECYGDEFAGRLEALAAQKIKNARQVTFSEINRWPRPIRLRNGVARLFSPHL